MQKGLNSGKRGYRSCAITNMINKKWLVSERNKLLNNQTMRNAVDLGIIVVSPQNMRQPPKIPQHLTKALAINSTML